MRRHRDRWGGGERRDVVFLFLAVLLYWCREDGGDECKALRVGKGLIWVGERQYITQRNKAME